MSSRPPFLLYFLPSWESCLLNKGRGTGCHFSALKLVVFIIHAHSHVAPRVVAGAAVSQMPYWFQITDITGSTPIYTNRSFNQRPHHPPSLSLSLFFRSFSLITPPHSFFPVFSLLIHTSHSLFTPLFCPSLHSPVSPSPPLIWAKERL